MKKFFTFAVIVFSFLLSACGFHLRGAESLPSQLHIIYLTGPQPYSEFMQELRNQLAILHIQVLENPSPQAITLNISNNGASNSQTSLSASEQTRNYIVSYQATYSLNTANGATILPSRTVSASQTIILQPNQLIENTPQLSTAEQQLIPQVIAQILEGISSIEVKQALDELSSHSSNTKKITSSRKAGH